MNYRVVNKERMPKVQQLWAECFEKKEDPFFRYYFEEYCPQDNTVIGGFDDQDKLLTMLHLNPYMLQIRGNKILTPYIVGVATAPEARGQHLIGKLLQLVFEMLRSQDFPFIFLLPVAEKIYSPYGFTFIDWHYKTSYSTLKNLPDILLVTQTLDEQILAPLYAQYTKNKNSPVRTHFQWHKLLKVTKAEGTECELIYYRKQLVGYLFYEDKANKQREISELIITDDYLDQQIKKGKKYPFMMARCLDARSALSKLLVTGVDNCEFNLLLTDNFIADNNHLLKIQIRQGQLHFTSTTELEDLALNMESFTQLYFGAKTVIELTEEGKIRVENVPKLGALNRLFPACPVYFNEYF